VTWRANGDYYTFREETIEACAPSVSGVYGLYNLRHQILIGSSANIRGALFHHLRETNFRFRRFEPTGFVFELCPPEFAELRTQELIREYDPILRTNRTIGLAALWRSWTTRHAVAFHSQVLVAKTQTGDEAQQVVTNIQKKQFKRFHLGREQFAIVATGFGAILLVMGLFILFPQLRNPSNVARQISLVWKTWASHPEESAQVASLTTPGIRNSSESLSQQAEASESNSETQTFQQAETSGEPPKRQIFVASEQTPDSDSVSAESQSALLEAKQQPPHKPPVAKKEGRKNAWSVQAMATPDRRIAIDWLEKLKAKGYNPFLINAEIKGQTWYRVRAGNFNTRQEAEALRMTLQSKEGFSDAFVAESTKSETPIALNQR
jgi:cell division septation protein DedD